MKFSLQTQVHSNINVKITIDVDMKTDTQSTTRDDDQDVHKTNADDKISNKSTMIQNEEINTGKHVEYICINKRRIFQRNLHFKTVSDYKNAADNNSDDKEEYKENNSSSDKS